MMTSPGTAEEPISSDRDLAAPLAALIAGHLPDTPVLLGV